jgi:hypothetical protein
MTRKEIREARIALYAQGKLMRKLDATGKPLMQMESDGELWQVWVTATHATPEELAYWRREHII